MRFDFTNGKLTGGNDKLVFVLRRGKAFVLVNMGLNPDLISQYEEILIQKGVIHELRNGKERNIPT